MLADQGLLSRLLVSAPDPAAGSRFWSEPSPESFAALDQYRTHITSVLAAPLPVADGKRNQLCPRRLPLSPSARTAWIKFADHIEGLIAPGGELEPIRGLANKLPEHAARLAAVLTLIDEISAAELPGAKPANAAKGGGQRSSFSGISNFSGNTRPNYGGQRWWMVCPAWHLRVGKLYLPSGGRIFACRRAYGLVYQSQREPAHERALTKAQNIRTKLGGSASLAEPFPEKPKGMWWRTYDRLRREAEEAELRSWIGVAQWLGMEI